MLRPTGGNVIIAPKPKTAETSSGIVLPGAAMARIDVGEIRAIAADIVDQVSAIPGDLVYYRTAAGVEIEHEGETLYAVPVGMIYAVIYDKTEAHAANGIECRSPECPDNEPKP
jgi:co-chaperonin GroES (HSP10)